MLDKNDCMALLVKLEDQGININVPMRKLVMSREVPLEVLKFISDNRGIEASNFYEMLRKKHNQSKYNKLVEYIKFNGIDPKLMEAEERLKQFDSQTYLFYKRKFREDKTFREITEEFDLDNPRVVEILDRAYFYMIGALMI